jgi:glucans biosynthesis protein
MTRLLVLLLLAAAGAAGGRAAPTAFDWQSLRLRARDLASRPYEPQQSRVPEWLRRLNYDQYRDIRFVPGRSLWLRERLPFQLQFFHPGFIFEHTVSISEIDGGFARPIPFLARLFDYGHNSVGPISPDMGFAGFRVLYPINKPGDEIGAFQGASYFRFLCAKAVYGLSARGLAIDTAQPGGEEFPNFDDFWIERPAPGAKALVVYALLDSPSAAGAYRFEIAPGAETVMHVNVTLYLRRNPKLLGIAPLTSMFWHGKTTDFETDDIRPEVHDSDGLMIETGMGEWLWRPLNNPASPVVAAFSVEDPCGFGLLQRERRFSAYEDIDAAYQLRPSAWVEPIGSWGRGSVQLVELPTPDETNDNIVACWVPADLPEPGRPLDFEYNLHWFLDQIRPPAGYVVATRHGRLRTQETGLERFVVDFDGPDLRRLPANPDPDSLSSAPTVEAVTWVGQGATLARDATVQKNPFNDTWRASFALQPDGSGRPVEIRCYLRRTPHVLTETWSYLWQP